MPLTKLLGYRSSYDHLIDEDYVHDLARGTLRKFVADNSEFQYEAACAALALLPVAATVAPYYRDLVKTWAVELFVGLANSTLYAEINRIDLTNARNLCVFRSDGVFGNHRLDHALPAF